MGTECSGIERGCVTASDVVSEDGASFGSFSDESDNDDAVQCLGVLKEI